MGGYRFPSRQSVVSSQWSLVSEQLTRRIDNGPSSFLHRNCSVQIQIKLQNIYNCFAQKAEVSTFCMRAYDLTYSILANASLPRHTGNLKRGRGRRDVWIETRARSGEHDATGNVLTRNFSTAALTRLINF